MQALEDRVVVITGAGSGIGRGMALAFAAAGAHVVAADIDEARAQQVADEITQRGRRALAIATDVADPSAAESLAKRSYREFGAVHVLCNNAGVFGLGAAYRCSESDWRRVLDVNLHGVIHGLQAFLPRMLNQPDEGHIVNTGSLAGLAVYPGYDPYTTSKFALAGLTDALRADVAAYGIGVSLLCPGEVRTNLMESASADDPERAEVLAETRRVLATGLDPLDVGRQVVAGVRENRAYIMTHPEAKAAVQERAGRVLAAFDAALAREQAPLAQPDGALRGLVAVVTGAGSGIGRGMALAFAEHGMHIALLDIERDAAQKVADEVQTYGVRALPLRVDVSDLDDMKGAADRVYTELGAAHVLCNNAGVFISGLSQSCTHEDWTWVLGVNLYGVIHGIQAFVPRMLAQGDGRHVVNTASIVGLMFAPTSVVYATAKHGVVGLSEALALDLAPRGIGVSVLCPGGVRTNIMRSARNRPARVAHTRPSPETDRVAAEAIEAGIDPLAVGREVVAGILRRDLYILPQPRAKPVAEVRFDAILKAFD